MKKKNAKVLLLIISLIMLTGCTKTLTDENKKAVKFEDTGKTLTENVLFNAKRENYIEVSINGEKLMLDAEVIK